MSSNGFVDVCISAGKLMCAFEREMKKPCMSLFIYEDLFIVAINWV